VTLSAAAEEQKNRPDRFFKLVAALAAACLVGFIAFVIVRGPSQPAVPGTAALKVAPPTVLKTGTAAPEFVLPNLRGGMPVSLSSYRGTPVVLNFFASWCPDCRTELGAVAAVARATQGRVAVIGVDSNETSATAANRLLSDAHATYPVAVDAHATVATQYLLTALPVSYFLDSAGKVVGVALGAQSVSSLDRWVARLGVHP
jgi:peroxiredoxin